MRIFHCFICVQENAEDSSGDDVIAVDLGTERFSLEYEVGSDNDDIISSTASVSGMSESVRFLK